MHTALVKMDNIGGGGREGANKRALALIFKRNYCIQFSTFIVNECVTNEPQRTSVRRLSQRGTFDLRRAGNSHGNGRG